MVKAYYGLRSGGSGGRTVSTLAEAEALLNGGCGVTTVRLEDESREIIGERLRDRDDPGRWVWWCDGDALQ